jgi:hypothetical protein
MRVDARIRGGRRATGRSAAAMTVLELGDQVIAAILADNTIN